VRVLSVVVGVGARTGGIAPFVGGSADELAKLGAEVTVLGTDLALAPWGVLRRQRRIRRDEWHPSLGQIDTRLFPARFPRRMAYSPALARAIRRIASEFDLVHIHNLWQFPQFTAYRAAREAGVPYVVSPHGALDPFLRRRGRTRKRVTSALWQDEMLREARLIHVTSEAERTSISDVAAGVPRAVVPCGLRVEEFANLPPPDAFRQARLGGYDGPLVLFLGRITQKKGLDILLRAFASVLRGRESRLAIVGPDDEGILPKLRNIASELGLTEAVDFLGPVYGEQRLAALSSADVWALPSHAENFGVAVVEAMAAGCTVLTTPEVNISPEIRAANAGVIAEGKPREFGEALARLLADDATRRDLGRRASVFARRYDWSAVGPELLQMYGYASGSSEEAALSSAE
jgi:glycosyltransferase involved in cell wall biosynthesis